MQHRPKAHATRAVVKRVVRPRWCVAATHIDAICEASTSSATSSSSRSSGTSTSSSSSVPSRVSNLKAREYIHVAKASSEGHSSSSCKPCATWGLCDETGAASSECSSSESDSRGDLDNEADNSQAKRAAMSPRIGQRSAKNTNSPRSHTVQTVDEACRSSHTLSSESSDVSRNEVKMKATRLPVGDSVESDSSSSKVKEILLRVTSTTVNSGVHSVAKHPTNDLAESKATKKRRISEAGTAVVTAVEERPSSHRNSWALGQGKRMGTPFQRIKAEGVQFLDERLRDNTFESKVCFWRKLLIFSYCSTPVTACE